MNFSEAMATRFIEARCDPNVCLYAAVRVCVN